MGLDAWLTSESGEEVIYWRKENHFHRYFCENGFADKKTTEDMVGPYYVSRKMLEDFLERIDTILASKLDKPITKLFSNGFTIKDGERTNHFVELTIEYDEDVAEELLPTQSGFFFGSTEYTTLYFKSLLKAKDVLENYLKDHPDEHQFVYDSWW